MSHSIRCAHCKGTHETVALVKACSGPRSRPRPVVMVAPHPSRPWLVETTVLASGETFTRQIQPEACGTCEVCTSSLQVRMYDKCRVLREWDAYNAPTHNAAISARFRAYND